MNGHISLILLKSLTIAIVISIAAAEEPCRLRAICYALDQSGSIDSRTEYPQLQSFTEKSARAFETLSSGSAKTIYSAVAFSSGTSSIEEGTEDLEGKFIPAVNRPRVFSGGTNIYGALDACYKRLQAAGNGSRVLVLVTDGLTSPGVDNSDLIKKSGVAIVTVGLGSNVDVSLLQRLATDPTFYIPATFSNLPQRSMEIAQAACAAVNTVDACEAAFNACDFTFGNRTALSFFNVPSTPDAVFTNRIMFKNQTMHIGFINTGSFIPQFIDNAGKAESITASGTPAFAPSAFKTFSIPNSKKSGSGVGHQTLMGTQPIDAKDKCVRVFFKAYQVLNADGYVQANVNLEKITPGACIVFRST